MHRYELFAFTKYHALGLGVIQGHLK